MTPRERVLAALAHREPDRLPIDCGAMRSTGIQAVAYARLKKHLGVAGGQTRVFDVIQQLAEPEPFYLDRFGIDAINAGREFPSKWKDWVLPDGSPCQIPACMDFRQEGGEWLASSQGLVLARMLRGSTYFSQEHFPLARDDWQSSLADVPALMGRVCWGALAEPLYEGGLSDENLRRIGEHVRHLRATSDRAIMIAFGANLFEWACYLRRMDNFLMDLAAEPEAAEALLDKLLETHLAGLDRLLPVIGENVDLIQLGDDLIEAGFQVLNPVQIGARNMEPERLKREFGKDITFWGGGCDTQHVLSRGTPQQVRDHVRRNVEILAPGGGFIFNQVHNILAEVPPENIVAMYEAARA